MISTVEETLEMVGISLLIYSLLDYMKGYFTGIELNFEGKTAAEAD